MNIVKFDTLKLLHRLKEAGMPDSQAEAIAESVADVLYTSDVATERDIKDLETRLEYKIAMHISEAKAELIRWAVGFALAQIALLVGILIKLF